MHCTRFTLQPYQYEYSCFSCGYNVIKQKYEVTKVQRREINFTNQFRCAQHKILCTCTKGYKINKSEDFKEFFNVLPIFKS